MILHDIADNPSMFLSQKINDVVDNPRFNDYIGATGVGLRNGGPGAAAYFLIWNRRE